MSHRVVHFEIPANQPENVAKFYTGLFGWKIEKAPIPGAEYYLCKTGDGPGIDGAIMKRVHPQQPWMNYVFVDSIEESLEQAKKLGGSVALTKMPVPGVGYFAAAKDPEGNIVGLWQDDKGAK